MEKRTVALDKNLLSEIVKIISRQRKVTKLVLFGSRVTKQVKKTSDIDLAVFGGGLSDRDLSLIRDELEETVKTPLKFDVVHFDTLSKENLKENILKEGVILYESQAP